MTDAPDAAFPAGDPSEQWRRSPSATTGTDGESDGRRRGTERSAVAAPTEDH